MPEGPDFDKMHLTHLQQLAPFFKRYGIKRTAPDKDGKHKPKNVVTLRAEYKALPQSQVEEAWQRYQQATAAVLDSGDDGATTSAKRRENFLG